MKSEKMKLRERALFLFAPEKGEEKFRERLIKEKDIQMASATGYGNHGASTVKNSMRGWIPGGGSAEDDIDLQGAKLRIRARDLYAGGGLGRSGPATLTTNVIGYGVQPKPKIDGEALGMSDEACDEWQKNTLREFRIWAENTMCDAERQKTFYAIQELAFRSMLMSGDCFVLFGMEANKRTPYQTTLRLLEADRISTPGSTADESSSAESDSGGRIIDGVEIDENGVVKKYHIVNRHPLASEDTRSTEWTSIDARGGDTDMPNILHIMTYERPEQRRGIPFAAAEIEMIKQLDRYLGSELAANVVSSMLTAFIISESDDGQTGLEDAVDEDDKLSDSGDLDLELAPGAIYSLPPGKSVKDVNPIRNNAAFESFVTTLYTLIGSSMGIPGEVLTKKYNSNYTAARSALLDFWKEVRVYRQKFVELFCKPVWEQWLSEAVALGRVEAQGFFDDPAIRQAWCGCLWTGMSMGHVDPLKEVNAAITRINNGISTREQETMEYNGGSFDANAAQLAKEALLMTSESADSTGNTNKKDTEKGDEDDGQNQDDV